MFSRIPIALLILRDLVHKAKKQNIKKERTHKKKKKTRKIIHTQY